MIKIEFVIKSLKAVAYDNDLVIGVCKFLQNSKTWNIVHTHVDSKYQGQGIAKKLVNCVVLNAKNSGVNIIADCSYAKKILKDIR